MELAQILDNKLFESIKNTSNSILEFENGLDKIIVLKRLDGDKQILSIVDFNCLFQNLYIVEKDGKITEFDVLVYFDGENKLVKEIIKNFVENLFKPVFEFCNSNQIPTSVYFAVDPEGWVYFDFVFSEKDENKIKIVKEMMSNINFNYEVDTFHTYCFTQKEFEKYESDGVKVQIL